MDQTDFDLVDVLNTIIPGEKHLPYMNYCGPGTRLDLKLNEDGTPKPGFEPVDRVDQAALKHDIAYSRNTDFRGRHEADKVMIKEILKIPSPTYRERFERCIVIPILCIKRFFGALLIRIMDLFA